MSLRYRTAIATLVSVMVIMAMLLLAYRFIVRDAYSGLQRDEAREELSRTKSVLDAELHSLDLLLVDWAAWDDMYEFVETRSPSFLTSNMPADILQTMHLNAIVIRNNAGQILQARSEGSDGRPLAVPGLTDAIPAGSPLLKYDADGRAAGFYQTSAGVMLLSSRPILHSDSKGPSRGTVVMARLVGREFTDRLTTMLSTDVHVHPIGASDVPDAVRAALSAGNEIVVGSGVDDDHIAAYCYLLDIEDRPALVLHTETPRNLEAQSGRTLLALLVTVGLTGAVLVIALMLVIDLTVVRRLRRLLDEMGNITGRGSSEGLRTQVTGRDEIGDVAAGVNAMLDRLEASSAERVRLEQAVSEQERLAEQAFRELEEGLIVVDAAGLCTA